MQRVATVLVGLVWAGTVAAQQAPASRADLAALVAAGDSAWLREDHPAAFAAYDAVLRADSSFSGRALLRAGLLHAWGNRFTPALAALRRYVRDAPADLDGRVALARTYAWAARYEQSLAQYDSVLARDGAYRDAIIGRATTLAWADRIPDAEAALVGHLDASPRDVEAWTLLGQFRRWRGAAHAAHEALQRALALDPDNASAREQSQWVEADIRPAAAALVVQARDSERNELLHLELSGALMTRSNVRVTASARSRRSTLGASGAVTVPGAHLLAQWQPGAAPWVLRAEAGAVQYAAELGSGSLQGRAALRASGRFGTRWRVSAGAGREPFDEVVTMARRELMFSVADVDVVYALNSRLGLALAASRGEVGGVGISDGRSTGLAVLRFAPRRGTQLALSHREIAWDDPAYGVFFAPQRWSVSELSAAWERPDELGLVLAGDLALGLQGVAFESDAMDRTATARAAMRLGWRPRPGREIVGALVYANVAGAGALTASDYRYGALTLTGRWTF